MIVTIWERLNKDEEWKHNHISDGYDENVLVPISENKEQTNKWAKSTWRAKKGYLDRNNCVWYEYNQQTPRTKVCNFCFTDENVCSYMHDLNSEESEVLWVCDNCLW